jgi:hypothetical protein
MLNGKEKGPLLVLFLRWAVLFVLFLCLFSFSVYVVGNFRDFKEGVQFPLLRFSLVLGIFTAVFSVPGFCLGLGSLVYRRKPGGVLKVLGYVLAFLAGTAVSAAAAFILAAAGGHP